MSSCDSGGCSFVGDPRSSCGGLSVEAGLMITSNATPPLPFAVSTTATKQIRTSCTLYNNIYKIKSFKLLNNCQTHQFTVAKSKTILPSPSNVNSRFLQRHKSEVTGTSLFIGACPKQNRYTAGQIQRIRQIDSGLTTLLCYHLK